MSGPRAMVGWVGLITLLTASPLFAAGTDDTVVVQVGPDSVLRLTRLQPEDGRITIDGRLREDVWQRLPAWDEFTIIEPDLMQRPPHRTYIRMTYDDKGLYVGADLRQPPETLLRRLSGRDAREINRDSINLTIDTSGEGRYGFWFGVNLGDSLMDGTVLPERKFSNEWDGPWRGRSQQTDTGWTAEFFIPWSAVAMPATGPVRRMGMFISRKFAAADQRWGWPALPETQPQFMSALQGIELESVAPRQQYNIYPFVSVTQDRIDNRVSYKPGADLFWRPSSNFQLTATVNPDFGNVESDEVVVNLTATETFFPEKRLFFLEGQEIFFASPRADVRSSSIGNAGLPYTMVNTRRIGGKPLRPTGLPAGTALDRRQLNEPVELLGAVQASGQVGAVRYGVMGAFENDVRWNYRVNGNPETLLEDGSDYGIARVLYEDAADGAYRGLGFLTTAVVNPARDAFVQGVDGHYLSRNGKVKLDGQVMTSDVDTLGRGYGGFVDLEYTYRRGLVQRFGAEYFDEQFDINDLGFLQRNNEYRLRSSLQLIQANLGWARDNFLDVRGFVQNNVSDDLFTGGGLFITDRITFRNLSRVLLRASYLPPQYDDLNSFGNGTYRVEEWTEFNARWDSDSTRAFGFGIGGGFREELMAGQTLLAEGGFSWRPIDNFSALLEWKYQNRDGWLLHQRRDLMATFNAEQWQAVMSLDFFLTARQQFRLSLQWVGVKARERDFYRIPERPGDLIGIDKPTGPGSRPSYDFSLSQYSFQARYRWEMAPLSDLFIVYTRQGDLPAALMDESFGDIFSNAWDQPLADYLVLKVRYRFGS
ncbi:MAG: DUF5916 domain-containing protein [Gammaproteobacteria bacterium]